MALKNYRVAREDRILGVNVCRVGSFFKEEGLPMLKFVILFFGGVMVLWWCFCSCVVVSFPTSKVIFFPIFHPIAF